MLLRTHSRAKQTGLFSAVVAGLVIVALQDLRPNSQDTSAFYLANIYQILADGNFSGPSVPLSTVAQPPPFSPPASAVWVNTLWLLSLVISLTCAMLATSLQQWARRYLENTQPAQCSPHKRARMRAFFAAGIDKFHAPWAVEVLPALVHLSLFIFFVGLLIYLFDINHTVFSAVVCWVALLSSVYVCMTLMPIFWPDSPYYAPLSSTAWIIYATISYAVLNIRFFVKSLSSTRQSFIRMSRTKRLYRRRIFGGVEMAAEEAALKQTSEIDLRVLEWTVDALGEDDTLEKFFESIPGFYQSHVVKDIRQFVPADLRGKILRTLTEFLHQATSSNSVSGPVKNRRVAVYLNAAGDVDPAAYYVMFGNFASGSWRRMLHSVELGHFLASWNNSTNGQFAQYIQGIIGLIISTVRERNDRWIALAMDHWGIPEHAVRDYLSHGNSALFANWIHFTRQLSLLPWVPIKIVQILYDFDIHNTLPELQHDFCDLWNEFVLEAKKGGPYCRHAQVLLYVRSLYISLHRGADTAPSGFFDPTAPFGYILDHLSSTPLCNNPSHRPNQTHRVHASSALETPESHAVTSVNSNVHVPHLDPDLANISPSPLPVSHSRGATLRPPDVPLSGHLSSRTPSSHTAWMSPPNPVTPGHSALAAQTQVIADEPSALPMATSDPQSTQIPAATTFTPELALAPSSRSVTITTLQHSAAEEHLTPSLSLEPRISSSSSPVLPRNTSGIVSDEAQVGNIDH